MPWTLKAAPPEEPVTLSEIKEHLRLEHSEHDTMLEGLVHASREWVEQVTSRALVEQTRVTYFREWQDSFELPGTPLRSVEEVRYTDTSGTTSTVSSDDYEVLTSTLPGQVVLGYSKNWPTATLHHSSNPIEIEYVCGYDPSDDSPPDYVVNVPQSIKNAIKLDVEMRYDRPPADYADKLRQVIDTLIAPYRVWSF